MPKVGGHSRIGSCPARQKARDSRSIASSLPRVTSTVGGRLRKARPAGHECARLRLRIAVQTRDAGILAPRHGSSLACRRASVGIPHGVRVRLELEDLGPGERSGMPGSCAAPPERREAHAHRGGMRVQPFETRPVSRPSRPDPSGPPA